MPNSPLSPEEAARALLTRRLVRTDYGTFCEHALAPLGQAPALHHRLMIRELQAVADGTTPRLMFNLPPGAAKSTYGTKLFPPWFAASRPVDIICAANTAKLAEGFSRESIGFLRDNVRALNTGMVRDNVEEWQLQNGSRYRATGIGGAIAGSRADIAFIDDPTRSRADAESPTVRESQWAWFTGDLRTRLKPGAAIVVIMTRWHPDDLGGRLIERQGTTENGGIWRVVSIPAQATSETDPLGRQIGEWLWSDDSYGYGADLQKAKVEFERAGATRDWSALYQQNPRPAEGAMFKIEKLWAEESPPIGLASVRAWDLAATAKIGTANPDWTVGLRLSRTATGGYVIEDVRRFRGGPEQVEQAIIDTAAADGPAVTIGLPQDPGQAGKAQVRYLTGQLHGYRIVASTETGSKATRADPVASQLNVGNVRMRKADWNAALVDELSGFPSSQHDDQVDALSRAFNMMKPSAMQRFRAMS